MQLNITASGFQISILYLILGVFVFAVTNDRSWKKLLFYFGGILICNIIFVLLVHPLAFWLYDLRTALGVSSQHAGHVHAGDFRFTEINPMNLLIILPFLEALPLYFFMKKQHFKIVSAGISNKEWVAISASAVLIIFGIALLFRSVKTMDKVPKKVLFYDKAI